MSRGPGHVQRTIAKAFEDQPEKRFTVEELCALAYPGEELADKHRDAVRRALRALEDDLNLTWSRAGSSGQRGWAYRVGRRTVA